MTGRRLYDHFTDVLALNRSMSHVRTALPSDQPEAGTVPPVAWAFLCERDRRVWTALAKTITPTRKAKR